MENQDIRWKQRFQNFEKAFLFFKTAVEKEHYTPIETGGLVQAFEFTFELAWKTIKDYIEEQGIDTKFPRDTIKQAFQSEIIEDGHVWIHMLEKRNELSHTYNESVATQAIEIIKHNYFPAIYQVYLYLKQKYEA